MATKKEAKEVETGNRDTSKNGSGGTTIIIQNTLNVTLDSAAHACQTATSVTWIASKMQTKTGAHKEKGKARGGRQNKNTDTEAGRKNRRKGNKQTQKEGALQTGTTTPTRK